VPSDQASLGEAGADQPTWRELFRRGLPRNALTGKHYRCGNMRTLANAMKAKGWEQPLFLTFRQAHELGGRVLRGSRGTRISWLKPGKGIRQFSVFNIAQTTLSLDDLEIPLPEPGEGTPPDVFAEVVLDQFRTHIEHFADESRYCAEQDRIFLSDREDFASLEAYYSMAFRLLMRWVAGRLHAGSPSAQGDAAVARLTAELGAAFLCRAVGLDYVGSGANGAERLAQTGTQSRSQAIREARRSFNYLARHLGLPCWSVDDERAAAAGESLDARDARLMDLAMATHDVCELWLESVDREIELDAEQLMLALADLHACRDAAEDLGATQLDCATVVQSQRRYSLGDHEGPCLASVDDQLFGAVAVA